MALAGIYIMLFAPSEIGLLLIIVVNFFATMELIRSAKNDRINKLVHLFALFSAFTPITIFYDLQFGVLVQIVGVFVAICMYLRHFNEIKLSDFVILLSSITLLPYALNSLTNIYLLENGKYMIVIPVICASVTDIFAYLVGKNFGKRKLAPVISPNKTIEGSIGGIIGCTTVIILYTYYFADILQIDIISAIFIGILGSIFGQAGDLFFSMIKRQSNIKDFSKLIPGHGGILDRFDSIIFTSLITFAILQITI